MPPGAIACLVCAYLVRMNTYITHLTQICVTWSVWINFYCMPLRFGLFYYAATDDWNNTVLEYGLGICILQVMHNNRICESLQCPYCSKDRSLLKEPPEIYLWKYIFTADCLCGKIIFSSKKFLNFLFHDFTQWLFYPIFLNSPLLNRLLFLPFT